jgi:predicted nucleic acid-binding protein
MIHVDTSILVDAFTGHQRSLPALRDLIERAEPLGISTLVLYEWLRGPRLEEEVALQEAVLPTGTAVPFGGREATLAARLYRQVRGARRRELDLGIAACALAGGAAFWTLNTQDFTDIPDLTLYQPA